MAKTIPYGHQAISWGDVVAVAKATRAEWMTMGPGVEALETALAEISQAKHAIAVSSGSAALHCAYAAIELGPGDEIITTAMTFASTATTAVNLGAKVLFADIHLDTGNIDPDAVEALVGPKTKAIVAVDYAGHPADLDELLTIGQKHGIPVIEDAAHSIGSTYRGRPVGGIADITTFSFFPTKNVTTGEGGAVLTNNDEFARKARLFRSHGMVRDAQRLVNSNEGPWHQEVQSLGLNYRLPDILARLGESQLARLEKFKTRRREVFSYYSTQLDGIANVTVPVEKPHVESMWHLYPLRVSAEIRRPVFETLRRNGVMVQVNYIPVYWHPFFADMGYQRGLTPNAERFYSEEISLPMYSNIRSRDLRKVTGTLLSSVNSGAAGK
jgi:dTDP-4-amino-4,6-dideoxygalactose transaminase